MMRKVGGKPAQGKKLDGEIKPSIDDVEISLHDTAFNNVSTTKHGLVPKAPNDTTKFLDGTGAWSTPAIVSSLSSDPPGVIKPFAGSALPSGYLWCDGAAVSRTTYAYLFSAIGTSYGVGDGSTTFNVPDLKGRFIVGKGAHADVSALGNSDGLADASRTVKHTHSVPRDGWGNTNETASGRLLTGDGATALPDATGNNTTGSGYPAYEVINYIISTGVTFTNATSAAPTAEVGPVAIAGSAGTFLRSDAAPKLANTAVTPGTYGSSANSPQIAVDQQGRITSAANVQVDHTGIANKGTNTHAQIDTHVGSTSNPHSTSDANLATSDVTTNNVSTSKHGFAPKAPNDATKFLDGTAAYDTVKDSDLATTDITTNDLSISKHGFAPKAPNDTTKFLRGDATWAVPSGGTSAPTGAIIAYGAASAPSGWLLCNGSAVSRTTYASLFAVTGTAFGAGDGSTTFNVPDLRGRAPLGVGTHADVNAIAKNDGVAVGSRTPNHAHTGPSHTHTGPSHTHTGPSHTHIVPTSDYGNTVDTATGRMLTGNGSTLPMATQTQNSGAGGTGATGAGGTGDTGASGTANTGTAAEPWLALQFIIKT